MPTTTATNHEESTMSATIVSRMSARLYVGATAKLWQAADGDWHYRTFGRCRRTIEGRASSFALALANVRRHG